MAFCTKCGHQLMNEERVCSRCGNTVARRVQTMTPPRDYTPPSPYIWAGDSLPGATPPVPQPQPQAYPRPFTQPNYMSPLANANYRCPRCNSQHAPVLDSRISASGWIIFALLLVFCFPFFWIGLLMKEDYAVCPTCRCQLS